MLKLENIMKRDVVAVAPEITLREVVEILTQNQVSGVPVVAGGVVVGVASTMDILEFQEDTPGGRAGGERAAPSRKPEGSAPASEFFSDMWEPSEIDALDRMTEDSVVWDRLSEYTVADVMTREIVSQPSDATVRDAARYMLDAGVHRLLVIDAGRLEGIVTTTDIVRAVAEGKLES
jgi:CBS domain-containing protein